MKLDSLLGISAKDLGLRPMVFLALFWLAMDWSGAPKTAPVPGQIFA